MDKRYYEEFFTIPEDFKANMTREAINETPETWLDFYPHTKYVEFLKTLIHAINGGTKSIWLTGNYGTGKSNAALVTQKLFMDDERRVRRWFSDCKDALSDGETLLTNLFDRRTEGTLVIYDYNAAGIGANEEFLVHLERGIAVALNEEGLNVPPKANLDAVINRLREESEYFFAVRDEMQSELAYLNASINTTEQLICELEKSHSQSDVPTDLLGDVQKVLHRRSIYLDLSVPNFKRWINEILSANNLKRIVYVFDEFHPFIEANKEELKTFEDIVENPSLSKFYLVPVSHMLLDAYFGESAKNPKKSNDRFHFRNLQMPNDTAFKLAYHAMKPNPDPVIADEWKIEKKNLWQAVRGIAETHFKPDDVSKQSFYDILPIHPIAAFLLKFLSESARSNQRSIFEYLKGSADGREFQDFIRVGGPGIASKQFLTADYLWKYFMERDDLGQNKDVSSIRTEFERIRSRAFQNADDDDEDLRVLKAILLFCLLARLNPDGHERLRPTVQNIELAFQGDGAIIGVRGIITRLAEKHCFSVVDGNIELFATSVGGKELIAKKSELESQFHKLLSAKTEDTLRRSSLNWINTSFSANRLDIRVSDVAHTTLQYIQPGTREKYSSNLNKDTGAACLWFVVAKNKNEQLQIPEKIENIIKQLRDHRIVMFYFSHLTFCDSNVSLWDEYITQYAQFMLENDTTAGEQRKKACDRLEKEWFDRMKKSDTRIKVYQFSDNEIVSNDITWANMKKFVEDYVRRTLPYCLDYLTNIPNAFGTSLKNWTHAGIVFDTTQLSGAQFAQPRQLIAQLASSAEKVSLDESWFQQNPSHPLAQIRTFFDKKISNTISKSSYLSLRRVYKELQRAPYGLKYNALTAFVLGFSLSHVLQKGYQWDNDQRTGALDVDSLIEIIETVVKDDGEDKIKAEKKICRLSPQEKIFVDKAPLMFGVTSMNPDARVEDVLLQIQSRIEQVSQRVPLWVLPEYIRTTDDPKAETIAEILNYICLAGSMSSKSGKAEERANAIKEVGRIILADSSIVETVANYIEGTNFLIAFQMYVKKTTPALVALADELGDTDGYSQAIRQKAMESAGWLWNETDISNEISDTILEYEVIKLLKPMAKYLGFVSYKVAVDSLYSAVVDSCKLPKTIILAAYPQLASLITAIVNRGSATDLKEGLGQCGELVQALFFDTSNKGTAHILQQRLSDIDIREKDLMRIFNSLPCRFSTEETTFLDDVRQKIETFEKNAVALQLKENWQRLTGSSSPTEWAGDTGIPARFAIAEISEASEITSAVDYPDAFSSDKLFSLLDIMSELQPVSVAECQNRFISAIVPQRFRKFKMSLSSLIDFLKSVHGSLPNKWPEKPDIDDFVRNQYRGAFAPQVTEKIRATSAETLKNRLLQLAQENPDLGLLFWE